MLDSDEFWEDAPWFDCLIEKSDKEMVTLRIGEGEGHVRRSGNIPVCKAIRGIVDPMLSSAVNWSGPGPGWGMRHLLLCNSYIYAVPLSVHTDNGGHRGREGES